MPKVKKGGDMMERQMNLFAEGGMMDDSGEVVNGVEVPPGSLKEEVADDVPARLSEGEFVIPADVVRYIGLEKLMAMRDKAKAGLDRMQEMGQVGNAEEVDNPDQLFSDAMPQEEEDLSGFESEIDGILAEDQQFASGGVVRKYADGGDVSLPADLAVAPVPEKSYKRAPISGFAMTKYANKEGEVRYIPTIDGKPLLPVPQGFSVDYVPIEEPVAPPPEAGTGGGTGAAPTGGGDSASDQSSGGDGGGLPGEGISITGQNLAFNALALNENKAAKAMFPVLTSVAAFIAESYLDDQIDKMEDAANAVAKNVVSETGMYTLAKTDGGIATIATQDSTKAQDVALFGGYFDANGNFVEVDETTAAMSKTTETAMDTRAAEEAQAAAEAAQAAAAEKAAADAKAAAARMSDSGYLTSSQKESIANQTDDPIAAMNALSGWATGSPSASSNPNVYSSSSSSGETSGGGITYGGSTYSASDYAGLSDSFGSSSDSGSSGGGGYSSVSGPGDYGSEPFAKGGLVKRKYPAKKKSKKTGLASK